MVFVGVAALVLTLATFVLAVLWRLGLALLRRPAPRFFRRTLGWHAGLLVLHLFVTVPVLLGVLAARIVGTRPDERGYGGPRLDADGSWLHQTRESLAAEREGRAEVDADVAQAAAGRAVTLTTRDGVTVRGFLVPPPPDRLAHGPRFAAVVVHGLFRGAIEVEPPAAMLHELGGEVLLLELRNHGESGHAQPTLGPDESLDVLAAVDHLRGRPETEGRPLVLFGVSIGTTATALAAPEIPDLAGIVLDAPIDDLEASARRWIGKAIPRPWSSLMLLSAEYLGGIPISSVKPGTALLGLDPEVEVLLIGAGHDVRAPPDRVKALFAALPTLPDRKEMWIDPEASHGKVWLDAPDEYHRRLARFCEKLSRSPPGAPAVGAAPGAPLPGD